MIILLRRNISFLKVNILAVFIVFFVQCIGQISNNAQSFNGNTFVEITDNNVFDIQTNSEITFEGWVKFCDAGIVFSKNWCNFQAGYYLNITNNGNFQFVAHQNTVCNNGFFFNLISTNTYSFDTWHHFGLTIVNTNNNVTVNLFVNGVLSISQSAIGVFNNSIEPLILGAYKGISGSYALGYKGLIDEFRIYNQALSINQLGMAIPNSSNLFLHYEMEPSSFSNQVMNNIGNTGVVNNGIYKNFNSIIQNINLVSTNNATIEFTIGADTTLCNNAPISLFPTPSYQNAIYLWNNSSSSQSLNIQNQGIYWLKVSIGQCFYIDTIVINTEVIYAGNDTSICEGQNITLSASGGTNYNWSSNIVDGVSFTPITTNIYTVTSTLSSGCVAMDQITVTLIPPPIVNAGPDQDVCQGSSITLFGSGADLYSWSGGIQNGVSFIPQGSGMYTLTGINALGCMNTDQVNVLINPLPNIFAGLDTLICPQTNLVFNASGGQTYSWSGGIQNGLPFEVDTAGTYIVTGTDVNGCSNIDDVLISFFPVNAINAGVDTSICEGEYVTLSASGGTSNYMWSDGISDGVPFYPDSSNIYVASNMDVNGCISYDSVVVNLLPLLQVNGGNDMVICEGEFIKLVGSGATSLVWSENIINDVLFQPSNGVHQYFLTGSSMNGCTNYDTVQVIVNPKPIVAFSSDKNKICPGEKILFINNSSSSVSCFWSFSNGVNLNSCDSFLLFFENPGYVDVNLNIIDFNGCQSTLNKTNYIEISTKPIADFVPSSYNLSLLDSIIYFMNTSVDANTYIWDFGDLTNLSFEVNPSHNFPVYTNLNYLVTLLAINDLGCTDTIQKLIKFKDEIVYYVPNTFTPDGDENNNIFKPVFSSGIDVFNYKLTIFDRWGEIIFETKDPSIGWDGTYGSEFNCQDGVYTWKIEYKLIDIDSRNNIYGHVNLLR